MSRGSLDSTNVIDLYRTYGWFHNFVEPSVVPNGDFVAQNSPKPYLSQYEGNAKLNRI